MDYNVDVNGDDEDIKGDEDSKGDGDSKFGIFLEFKSSKCWKVKKEKFFKEGKDVDVFSMFDVEGVGKEEDWGEDEDVNIVFVDLKEVFKKLVFFKKKKLIKENDLVIKVVVEVVVRVVKFVVVKKKEKNYYN